MPQDDDDDDDDDDNDGDDNKFCKIAKSKISLVAPYRRCWDLQACFFVLIFVHSNEALILMLL